MILSLSLSLPIFHSSATKGGGKDLFYMDIYFDESLLVATKPEAKADEESETDANAENRTDRRFRIRFESISLLAARLFETVVAASRAALVSTDSSVSEPEETDIVADLWESLDAMEGVATAAAAAAKAGEHQVGGTDDAAVAADMDGGRQLYDGEVHCPQRYMRGGGATHTGRQLDAAAAAEFETDGLAAAAEFETDGLAAESVLATATATLPTGALIRPFCDSRSIH